MTTRPSTEGCTELTCMYHGHDNYEKAKHLDACPVRRYTEHLSYAVRQTCDCSDLVSAIQESVYS